MYLEELQDARHDLVLEKKSHPMFLPRYAGRALVMSLKQQRLRNIFAVNNFLYYKYVYYRNFAILLKINRIFKICLRNILSMYLEIYSLNSVYVSAILNKIVIFLNFKFIL